MKVEVQSKFLEEALSKNFLVSMPPHNFVLKTKGTNSLSCYSADKGFTQYIFSTCPGMVSEQGQCTVDGYKLYNIIKTLNGLIGLILENNKILVTFQKKRFRIPTDPSIAIMLPRPNMNNVVNLPVPLDRLCNEMRRVLPFIESPSKNNELFIWRQSLNMYFKDSALRIFGGNPFRMCKMEMKLKEKVPDQEINMLGTCATVLSKLFSAGSQMDSIKVGDRFICFSNHNTFYFLTPLNLQYPNTAGLWSKMQPRKSIMVHYDQFKKAIDRATILTPESSTEPTLPVILDVNGTELDITISGEKMEETVEIVENNEGLFVKEGYSPHQIQMAIRGVNPTYALQLDFIKEEHPMFVVSDGYDVLCQFKREVTTT